MGERAVGTRLTVTNDGKFLVEQPDNEIMAADEAMDAFVEEAHGEQTLSQNAPYIEYHLRPVVYFTMRLLAMFCKARRMTRAETDSLLRFLRPIPFGHDGVEDGGPKHDVTHLVRDMPFHPVIGLSIGVLSRRPGSTRAEYAEQLAMSDALVVPQSQRDFLLEDRLRDWYDPAQFPVWRQVRDLAVFVTKVADSLVVNLRQIKDVTYEDDLAKHRYKVKAELERIGRSVDDAEIDYFARMSMNFKRLDQISKREEHKEALEILGSRLGLGGIAEMIWREQARTFFEHKPGPEVMTYSPPRHGPTMRLSPPSLLAG